MRNIVLGLAVLVVAGCTAAPERSPSVAAPSVEASSAQLPQRQAPEPGKPTSPLLPSAFFDDGAGEFVAWRCTPAQDLITAATDKQLRLWSNQGYYQLDRAVVASGTRYVKNDLTFWSKGAEAQVTSDNGRLECQREGRRRALSRAEQPEAIFRAVGSEPGWILSLERQSPTLRLSMAKGERVFALPYRVAGTENGRQASMTLVSQDDRRPFTLQLRAKACFDATSGAPYPVSVLLKTRTQQLRGCGQGIEKRP